MVVALVVDAKISGISGTSGMWGIWGISPIALDRSFLCDVRRGGGRGGGRV